MKLETNFKEFLLLNAECPCFGRKCGICVHEKSFLGHPPSIFVENDNTRTYAFWPVIELLTPTKRKRQMRLF